MNKILKLLLISGIIFTLSIESLYAQTDFETSLSESEGNGKGLFLLSHIQIAFSEWAPAITYISSDVFKEDSQLAGVYLLSASAGFFVPLTLVRDQPVTLGQMCLSYYAAHRGYLVGFALADILYNWGEEVYMPPTFPFFDF